MPLFLVDFGAWLLQPSADLAREISAERAENKGYRACSDYLLLPPLRDSPECYQTAVTQGASEVLI